jgi:O-antigen ligase
LKPLREKTLDILVKVTFSTYLLFMLGFFVIPNAVDQYKFYSVAVFIPALALVPRMASTLGADRLLLAIVAYLLWMLLSSFWSASFDTPDFIKTSRLVAYILVFVLLTGYAARRNPALLERAVAFVSLAAALAAIVSVPLWYTQHPFSNTRIVGIGTLDNPNPSAFVYGFFALLSLHLALARETTSGRSLFIGATLVLSAFVVLTRSNTGILATFSSLAVLLSLGRRGRLVHLGAGILVTGIAGLFLAYSIGLLGSHMDNGLLERIPIWETVVEQIQRAPLIGHGYQKELIPNADGSPALSNYAHSALLASFRDGGLVGVALHVLVLGIALVSALRVFRLSGDPAFLAYLLFGFVCMLADTDQLITRPRELWVIFWWPLAVIIADRVKRRTAPGPSGNHPGE